MFVNNNKTFWVSLGLVIAINPITVLAVSRSIEGKTVSPIIGRSPTLIFDRLTDIDGKDDVEMLSALGVQYPDLTREQISQFEQLAFDANVSAKIAPNNFSAILSSPKEEVFNDEDGDKFKEYQDVSLNLNWFYKNNDQWLSLPQDELASPFCTLKKDGKSGPFKVEARADFDLVTQAGLPSTTHYKNVNKAFLVNIISDCIEIKYEAITSVQPNRTDGAASYQGKNFVYSLGFLVPSKDNPDVIPFPTTGFKGATFTLFIDENKTDAYQYNWKISSEYASMHIDDARGYVNVIFNDVDPKKIINDLPLTITVTGESKSTPDAKASYAFTLNKWFVFNKTTVNYEDATAFCKSFGQNGAGKDLYRLPTVKELTNIDTTSTKAYQRTAGDGLLPEWGRIQEGVFNVNGYYKNTLDVPSKAKAWTNEVNYAEEVAVIVDLVKDGKYFANIPITEQQTALCISDN